ncbi:MAG: SPOR domain-containing protein [Treponema sp.]|nr:SPOR domain-containing protein [Treponema sp.]
MKDVKTKVLVCLVLAASVLFVSATWEGAATSVATGELATETYGIATNSFPRNTVVDVTNLENNRSVRVLVVSGLNNSGLLATLSRGAADSIGMNGNSVRRIRITQPSDSIAFAHIRRGPLPDLDEAVAPDGSGASADTLEAPASMETELAGAVSSVPAGPQTVAPADRGSAEVAMPAEPEPDATGGYAWIVDERPTYAQAYDPSSGDSMLAYTRQDESAYDLLAHGQDDLDLDMDMYLDLYDIPQIAVFPEESAPYVALETMDTQLGSMPDVQGEMTPAISRPAGPVRTVMHEPQIYVPDFRFTMVPDEERLPPVRERGIGQADIIAPIGETLASGLPPASALDVFGDLETRDTQPQGHNVGLTVHRDVPSNFSPFRVELVSSLERNRWFVQLGAFTNFKRVEEEISRLEMGYPYPVIIQKVGTDTNPMFRVLLGPLNQGESAAVLRRVRSVGHTEAFVRRAN